MVPVARIAAVVLACLGAEAAYADDCTAAAHRVLGFLKEEAQGTRHEQQIRESIEAKGEGPMIAQVASSLSSDQCTFLLIAPDSTVRALAISMLPERNGE